MKWRDFPESYARAQHYAIGYIVSMRLFPGFVSMVDEGINGYEKFKPVL